MKTTSLLKLFSILAFAAMSVAPANCAVLYQTDFTGSNGTTPTDWTANASLTIQSNNYQVASASSNAVSYYDGTGAGSFSDYSIVSDFSLSAASSGTVIGLLGYVSTASPTTVYLGRVRLTSAGVGQRELYQSNSGTLTQIGSASSTFAVSSSNTYRLTFDLTGLDGTTPGDLTVSLFNVTGGSAVSTLTGNDATPFTAGTGGVRVTTGATNTISFQNYEIATVPEPSTLALMGFGFAGVLYGWRSRRS